MIDTKEKLMDAAERLIGEQGFAATSLRHIIAAAGVNLAAVHYHFGSKECLLDALVKRKATGVNAARIAMLDRFEREAEGGPVTVEQVLEAFLAPVFVMAGRDPDFVKLMGRMYAEGLMPLLVARHFQPVTVRFLAALTRSLPDLPKEELLWRVHFTIGAMAHSLSAGHTWAKIAGGTGDPVDPRVLTDRLVAFLGAGLHAPVPLAAVREER